MDDSLSLETLAVRAGTLRSEYNEHSEALFLTSSFCFTSAQDAATRFANSEDNYTYSRFTNPTVTMFQDRLAALEGGEACIATASGMAAIMSVVMSALQAGDHLVSSRSLFGSTLGMFSQIFSKFGITTTFVDPTDLNAWREAVRPETKMFFSRRPRTRSPSWPTSPRSRPSPRRRRRCSWSTTVSAARRCSSRSSWVPTW